MKYKQKIDSFIALILILIGITTMLLPIMNILDIKKILIIIFTIYAVINLIQYLITIKSKDIEGLLTSIASLIPIILLFFIDYKLPKNLATSMLVWITLMSIIKLKKTDYYHDRRDRMWKIRLLTLLIFIITGLLMTINLNYPEEVQIIIIGFFFLIHGILELFDPLIKTIINHA